MVCWLFVRHQTHISLDNKTALAIQDGFPDRHTIPLCFCIHLQFSSRNPKYLDMKALWGPLFREELQEQLQKFRPLPPRAGVPARLRGLASSGRGALWPNLNLWISTHPGASGCSFSPQQIQIQIQIQVMPIQIQVIQIQIQFKQKQLQKQTQIQLQSSLNPWSMTDVRTFQCPMYCNVCHG